VVPEIPAAPGIGCAIAHYSGVEVIGASGVAINRRSYANSTRVLKTDSAPENRVFAAIDNTRKPVDEAWKVWVNQNIPPCFPADGPIPTGLGSLTNSTLRTAAYSASTISRSFYEALQTACKNDLIDVGKDLTIKSVIVP